MNPPLRASHPASSSLSAGQWGQRERAGRHPGAPDNQSRRHPRRARGAGHSSPRWGAPAPTLPWSAVNSAVRVSSVAEWFLACRWRDKKSRWMVRADAFITVDYPVTSFDEHEDRVLRTLIEWAEARSALTVRPLAAIDDLGAHDVGVLDSGLDKRLAGVRCAHGQALESDEGIARALKAGVRVVCVRQRQPALLAALPAPPAPAGGADR